jgi:hypothetical protein
VKALLVIVGWCLLLVLCWPLAILAIVLWPLLWLVSLPFRVIGLHACSVTAATPWAVHRNGRLGIAAGRCARAKPRRI